MKPAIEIRQLSKMYALRNEEPYLSLRQTLFSQFRPQPKKKMNEAGFYALKDVSLDVSPGDRIGIVGKNGAGKSTLLKILSRITMPTSGSVVVRGRFSSLLEVGTGFHPELTGRENIYLNATILGLSTAEINDKLDTIVDFSGIEKFLDIPLKNYSTGMQLRLAFSVAAHLEPDILMIDEVLAVGDIEFQNKCIKRIENLSSHTDRTILLVSHNMNHISSICNKAILLEEGKLVEKGTTGEIISSYISKIENKSAEFTWPVGSRPGNDIVQLESVRIVNGHHQTQMNFKVSETIGIEMIYEVLQENQVLWLGHNLHNYLSVNVFDTHSVKSEFYNKPHPKGKFRSVVWIPPNLLNTGSYYISSAIFNHSMNVIHLHEKEIVLFKVYESIEELTAKGLSAGEFPGVVRPFLDWHIDKF